MIAFYITVSIAIIYALIRAKHDSYISNGGWKRWAFIEAVIIDLVVVGLAVYAFSLSWYQVFGLVLSFAFIFWIEFDCACGWHRTGDILYISEFGWDARARASWHYNRPFWFFKNPRGLKYLMFKIFDAFIIIAGTISIINTYG